VSTFDGEQDSRPDNTQIPIVVQIPYGATFSNAVDMNAGEVQSTVIPPGKKTQCLYGCLLISNDNEKQPGKIVKLALNNLGGTPVAAALDPLNSPDRMIMSNDHDLITLNNGVELPALGLGVFQSPPEETVFAVETALRDGYRLIDTAAAYKNEREVGLQTLDERRVCSAGVACGDVSGSAQLARVIGRFDSGRLVIEDPIEETAKSLAISPR